MTSVLFGLLHSEQGVVGVVAVALDGVVFCALRVYFGTVWAPVLAHGFNNTLGLRDVLRRGSGVRLLVTEPMVRAGGDIRLCPRCRATHEGE